jgi:acid phosphatase family membrane protein YuiD
MNDIFIGCLISLLTAQIIKFAVNFIKNRKVNFKMLYSNGAMPSSHSSILATLVFLVGFDQGVKSPLFAVTLVLSLLIIGDAMGIRSQTGKQSIILNHLVDKGMIDRQQINNIRLSELVGHKPSEVLAGIILGIIVSLIYVSWILPL